MSDDRGLINEKLNQAIAILDELQIDAWLTFVRETSLSPDPVLPLILGFDMVWQSAFILTRSGERIAIVGKHDKENVERLGGYTQIIPYVQGIRAPLTEALTELNPAQIALNYSTSDVAADGLSHGLYLLLNEHLAGTAFPERFISAEQIVAALRGRKSTTEVARIRAAIASTEQVYAEAGEELEAGRSEIQIGEFFHQWIDARRFGTSWDRAYCPAVNTGPDSAVGHAGPTDLSIAPGHIIHMDFGIKQDGFCSDLQRNWYVLRPGESEAPPEVRAAYAAAHRALLAGFAALKPGVEGWQVDEAARSTLVAAGYPAYEHAFGHLLGRVAHDGSTVLGPRWERYGRTPYLKVEEGNVFAIELGVPVPGYGYIGLEENVLITVQGAEWLSTPQTDIWLV